MFGLFTNPIEKKKIEKNRVKKKKLPIQLKNLFHVSLCLFAAYVIKIKYNYLDFLLKIHEASIKDHMHNMWEFSVFACMRLYFNIHQNI